MAALLLIRHCQSSGQEPDAPLSETGLLQAEKLADFLVDQPIDRIVASSYRRAQQSIAPLAARLALPVHTEEGLVERRLSAQPLENWRQVLRDSFDDLDLCAPGGESGRQVQKRAWAALQPLLAGDDKLPVVVSHGNLISLVFNSLDAEFGYEQWDALSNPDVFLLQKEGDGKMGFERLWA